MVDGVPAARGPRGVATKDGLAAATLDQPVERATRSLGEVLDVWDKLRPGLLAFVEEMSLETQRLQANPTATFQSRKDGKPVPRETWLREVAHDYVTWTEKLSRSLASMTKVVDEACRLREFLTGGGDERQDLLNASDSELIRLLVDVAVARGLVRDIVRTARERGYEIVVDG